MRRLRPLAHLHVRRARPLPAVVVVVALALAAIALAAIAGSAHAADGGEGVGDAPITSLGAPEQVIGSETDGASSGGASIIDDTTTTTIEAETPASAPSTTLDANSSDIELRREQARLVLERNALQAALLRHESRRQEAELAADAAIAAIAQRLVDLLDQGEDARLLALVAARDEVDPATRTQLVAALDPRDQALVTAHDAAVASVATLAERAEQARRDALDLGTRVAAIDALIASRAEPTEAELERARGERYTFDADYVFATGPIPGIGYWGAMSGGSALSGWMGFAGAAVGGIGCDPTDAKLRPTGKVESGEASWYGPGFDGDPTANGEVFDTTQMTAAHRTLPFGTIVRVYSSATARCAFVRINDRGPFVDGRVIDLSRAAADAIGMESVAPVQLEVYEAAAATP